MAQSSGGGAEQEGRSAPSGPPGFPFALTLAAFATLALFAWWTGGEVYRSGPQLQVRAERGAVVFAWSDEIAAPFARRLSEAYKDWKGKTDRIVIEFNSPGGSIAEGRFAIAEIEKMKSTATVETRVGPRRMCASMCVPVFLAGDIRISAASSRFMFHEPALYDAVTEERARQPKFERDYESARFFRRYFDSADINPEWRAKLERDWKGRDLWFTGAELVEQRSGVVQRLE
ncbi:MAG: ATP-dependent Clp protease proteolytic subunit [Parvularculaceae bacterium]